MQSAHVIQVFDYGNHGGLPYIAMELLEGENLASRLAARGTLTPDEVGKIVSEVARGLGDRVRLLGPVHREQLFPLFAGADLFAFPSRHEGFGIPVLEAMAQETPVLCSEIPALREVAGDAARFVAPDDVDAWVAALTDLLTDADARGALVAAGNARVAGFSWGKCARETAAVYHEALDG